MALSEEEFKADVFRFTAELSAKTGVDLDPEGVWESLQHSRVKPDGPTHEEVIKYPYG